MLPVAESTTTTQIIREDPAIEAYRTQLLEQVNTFIQDQLQRYNADPNAQFLPPNYQVAAQNPLQQKASAMAQAGIGMYAPYLQRGSDLSQLGAEGVQTYGFGGLQEAFGATREGQNMLAQAAQRANAYRNLPFTYQQRAANYLQGASGLGRNVLGTGRADIQSAIQQANRGQGIANQYLTGALDVGRGAMARGLGSLDAAMGLANQNIAQGREGLGGVAGQAQQAAQQGAAEARVGQLGIGQELSAADQRMLDAQQMMGQAAEQGEQAAGQGQAAINQALQRGDLSTREAQRLLRQSGGQFDPSSVDRFMNPYEDAVVQRTLADIRREGDIREQGLQAQAANVGAFGGSRQAVAEQELGRNILDQQAKAASQLRQAGYGQASQQAQQAFEQAKQRQQGLAESFGSLGQSGAQLGVSGAQVGAGLGMDAAGMRERMGQQLLSSGLQRGQLGLSGAQAGAGLGMDAAGMGMQAAGMGRDVYSQLAQLGIGQGQLGLSGAQAGFGMGSQTAGLQRDIGSQLASNALAGGQLGMSGAQLGGQLGMQAAGIEQGVGQQMGQLGLGFGGLEQQNVNQLMGMAGASGQFGQNLASLAGMGGQLGQNLNQMGLQQAGLGQLVQDMYGRDIKQLEAFGGRDQAYDQAILDATRMNAMQMYQMPYQQMGFLSDIYKGVPGSQQAITVQGQSSPSPFQQVAGLGIAGLSALGGAKTAGLF